MGYGVFTSNDVNLLIIHLYSSTVTCEPYMGQCTCKTGVTGRRCDECGIMSFHLTNAGCERK